MTKNIAVIGFLTLCLFATSYGQSTSTKVQIVGIDPTKNVVQLPNTTTNPLPVAVMNGSPARKPYQIRASVAPIGTAISSVVVPLPAGKRFVIENISAITRAPEGIKMEVNFFSYLDSNGDGIGDVSDITFHRVALTDQGIFDGVSIAAANHKVLVFADEQIGTNHMQLVLQARLNGITSGFTQAQVTFSGYLEDLPAVQ